MLPIRLSANLAERGSRSNSSLCEMVFTAPTPHTQTPLSPSMQWLTLLGNSSSCNSSMGEAKWIPVPMLLLGQGAENSYPLALLKRRQIISCYCQMGKVKVTTSDHVLDNVCTHDDHTS